MDRINASWARIGQPQIPQSPVPPVLAPQPDGTAEGHNFYRLPIDFAFFRSKTAPFVIPATADIPFFSGG